MIRVMGKIAWLAAVGAMIFGNGSTAAADAKPEPPRSFRPVVRPPSPHVRGLARNDVDRFILATLEEKKVGLNPDADCATLIRRVCFDLTGLPPTLAEIESYFTDNSPDAYEKMVDRYLASPHYGERWGKHWLDTAGYADSNGYFNADSDRPLAWRYRDYVVKAFNADKPYDRFVKEQLAGDELVGYSPSGDVTPDMVEALTATHFIRNAPDGTGESDGNPDEVRIDRYTVLEGNVQHVMTSLLGITVQCARCHDHKFEPITQKEYYGLQAIFFPVYNPEKWVKPNDRVVSVGTRAELAVIQRRNDLIDRQVKAAQSGLAAIAEPLREQFLDERLRGLDAPVRESVIEAVKVAKDKRTAAMQSLLKANAKAIQISDDEMAKRFPEFAALRDSVKQAIAEREKDRPKAPEKIAAYVETDPNPPMHHVLKRGRHNQPGAEVQPGAPAALTTANNSYRIPPRPNGRVSTGRRLAFANWVMSPENPLFARVMANRVWQHHFGGGLVATSDNLGASGATASHPELLDYLAAELVRSGWSVKALHRLILASATYRQTSTKRERLDAIDPDNRFLAHFPIRRLDAEAVRDSMLAISGELDLRIGGVFIPSQRTAEGVVEIPETTVGAQRRSNYLQQRRTQVVTFLQLFDAPAIVSTCGNRSPSTVPLQSLALLNSEFARRRAKSFAIRLTRDFGNDKEKKLNNAFRLVAGRVPLAEELSACEKFLAAQQMVYAKEKDADERAWVDLCQMLLASNAFLYVE
jgi:hypothetical protein